MRTFIFTNTETYKQIVIVAHDAEEAYKALKAEVGDITNWIVLGAQG